MTQVGTIAGRSLVAITPRAAHAGGTQGPSRATFISQLIAARQHLASQRARRRAPVAEALTTYDAAGRLSERRMPPGYRLEIDA